MRVQITFPPGEDFDGEEPEDQDLEGDFVLAAVHSGSGKEGQTRVVVGGNLEAAELRNLMASVIQEMAACAEQAGVNEAFVSALEVAMRERMTIGLAYIEALARDRLQLITLYERERAKEMGGSVNHPPVLMEGPKGDN